MNNKKVNTKAYETPLEIDGFDIELNEEKLQRIDRLVDDYENLISNRIDQAYIEETTWANKLADRIALFGGSWNFIVLFFLFLFVWITWNLVPVLADYRFDPNPFILLNLLLSLLAAFQAPIIMMSQNRQAARDKRESIIDFAINYKSEYEINEMQARLAQISERLDEISLALNEIKKNNTKTTSAEEVDISNAQYKVER